MAESPRVQPVAIPPNDPALGLVRLLRPDGTLLEGAEPPALSEGALLKLLRDMLRIRVLDERMLARQRQGKVGFFGTVTGQEAMPAAAAAVLRDEEWVFPALRENAIMLARGFSLVRWIAQVYGNDLDVQRGRQQPSHHAAREVHQVSWGSCMATQVPHAVGAAWAARIRGERGKAFLGFIGDGATSEPDFHTAMNFAGVFRPPIVLVVQNNHWAISVPVARQTASATLAVKAHAYGLPAVRVDGNDVLALVSVLDEALQRAREGRGPTFVEAVTYRIGAHSSSDDPRLYRSEQEVEAWRRQDPVLRFERYLKHRGLLDDERRAALWDELDAEVRDAIAEVEQAPPPARDSMFEDVYATPPWSLREQREEMRRHPPAPRH